jgi:hypothetical protein
VRLRRERSGHQKRQREAAQSLLSHVVSIPLSGYWIG